MELGTQGHGVDHDGLLLGVIVEDHDLEQPAGAVRSNDEIPPDAWDDSYGVFDGCCMSSSRTPCLRALSAISTTTR